VARWAAGAKWAAGPAPDDQSDTPLVLSLSEGLGAAFRMLSAMLCPMNARIDLVLEDVLRLSAEERSAVAAALIDSLETSDEGSVAGAWRAELLRRRADLRAGLVQGAPWSEVRARMSAM
jgi:putative addiction module component (TIGR02574 family)